MDVRPAWHTTRGLHGSIIRITDYGFLRHVLNLVIRIRIFTAFGSTGHTDYGILRHFSKIAIRIRTDYGRIWKTLENFYGSVRLCFTETPQLQVVITLPSGIQIKQFKVLWASAINEFYEYKVILYKICCNCKQNVINNDVIVRHR